MPRWPKPETISCCEYEGCGRETGPNGLYCVEHRFVVWKKKILKRASPPPPPLPPRRERQQPLVRRTSMRLCVPPDEVHDLTTTATDTEPELERADRFDLTPSPMVVPTATKTFAYADGLDTYRWPHPMATAHDTHSARLGRRRAMYAIVR
jgi:hypothetical protein